MYKYLCILIILLHLSVDAQAQNGKTAKKTKCLNPPRTARRVELVIKECQEEVKSKLISEAFQILKEEIRKEHPTFGIDDDINDESFSYAENSPDHTKQQHTESVTQQEQPPQQLYELVSHNDIPTRRMARLIHRIRRVGDLSSGIYHPTLVPYEDKRIAGCLLHCVYAKNNAIDALGWPTLDGLVNFYSEGVNEHGFFMATLRSVNLCLRAGTQKYRVNRRKQPEKGESCDLAFDVFDCISDQITGYCLDHYKH